MEQTLLDLIKERFECDTLIPNEVSPLILAYIGDAFYEMVVRTIEISKGNRQVNKLHKDSVKLVNAGTQAGLADALQDIMSEEELNIYKRGRNAKANTSAKNASIGDYRKATGFEALMGYLYLAGRQERAIELIKTGFDKINL